MYWINAWSPHWHTHWRGRKILKTVKICASSDVQIRTAPRLGVFPSFGERIVDGPASSRIHPEPACREIETLDTPTAIASDPETARFVGTGTFCGLSEVSAAVVVEMLVSVRGRMNRSAIEPGKDCGSETCIGRLPGELLWYTCCCVRVGVKSDASVMKRDDRSDSSSTSWKFGSHKYCADSVREPDG